MGSVNLSGLAVQPNLQLEEMYPRSTCYSTAECGGMVDDCETNTDMLGRTSATHSMIYIGTLLDRDRCNIPLERMELPVQGWQTGIYGGTESTPAYNHFESASIL